MEEQPTDMNGAPLARPKRISEGAQGGRGRSPNDEEIDVADIPKEMPTAPPEVLGQRRIMKVRRPDAPAGPTVNPFASFAAKAPATTAPPPSPPKAFSFAPAPPPPALVSSPSEGKPKTFAFSFAADAPTWAKAAEEPKKEDVVQREALHANTVAPLTGEEDENTEYVCQVRAYLMVDKAWSDIGAGEFKVNCTKGAAPATARVLMREEKTRRLAINVPLGLSFALGGMIEGQAAFHFSCVTPEGKKSYLLKQTKSMTRGTLLELYSTLKHYQTEMLTKC